jgi:prefoldin subunit 5
MKEIQLESSSSQLPLSPTLQSKVDYINSLHIEIIKDLTNAFNKAIILGGELTHLKDSLPHGQFIPFVKEHFTSFNTQRTAQNYMKIFKNQETLRVELHGKLDIGSALKFLSKKKESGKITESEQETLKVLDEHTIKVNNIIRKFNSLEKKGVKKALEYFSENQTDKELLLEAVSVKKEKTVKNIDEQLNQITRMIDRLRKKKEKLNKTKKERQRYDSIENLFR